MEGSENLGGETEWIRLLETPPQSDWGDLALPCFTLARMLRKAPPQIAIELAQAVNDRNQGIRAVAAGPYVNLTFNREQYAPELLAGLAAPDFGTLQEGEGKRVVIDMSSPNIAKPFGIGHLRSTVIGQAIYNILGASGYTPVRVNHLGDWGTQFGKQITAYKHWGSDEVLAQDPIGESLKLYVRFHEEAVEHPELEDEAREWFRKLENGDEEANRLWAYFVKISLSEFDRMYARLNVKFDYTLGESFYNDKMQPVIEELRQLNLLEESDGAYVVRLEEEQLPPCLILKKDGTSIYPTRDLATAIYRREVMGADRLLYVVGGEQKLHFQQVFSVLKRMGKSWSEACTHVPFGLMRFEGKKMSTRRGKVIQLDEVLNEAVARALAVIEEKSPHLEHKEQVAEQVGIGAIIFGDLKNSRINEVDFSLEEALQFEGETGPYVQYTYARIQSVLDKGRSYEKGSRPVTSENADQEEYAAMEPLGDAGWELLKQLADYPVYLGRAASALEPSVMARYAIETAQKFNRFYNKERILTEQQVQRDVRLELARLTGERLAVTLHLLGVQAPERM
ncbi:arginine--tRNA ligase [Paenibacillus lacisoli]